MLLSGCSKPEINPNEEGIYEQDGVLFSYLYPLKEDSVKSLAAAEGDEKDDGQV